MQQFQLKENVAIRGPPNTVEEKKHLEDVTHDMASQAYAHINTGMKHFQQSPNQSQGMYGLLSSANSQLYLQSLENHQFDVYQTATVFNEISSPLPLQWKLLKATVMKSL